MGRQAYPVPISRAALGANTSGDFNQDAADSKQTYYEAYRMIIKTYARVFSSNCDATLSLLERLYGCEPHLRFAVGDVELAGIGDVLVVAGSDEALAPIRNTHGPFVVRDIDAAHTELLAGGATITQPITEVATGKMLYARHPDGLHIEYLQFTEELVERIVGQPHRGAIMP